MPENNKLSFHSNGDDVLSLRVYNVGMEKCKSLYQWGPGIRNFYLIHHVITGKGVYQTGKSIYEIGAGNTFLIYPNTEVTYYADENDPWEYYWVGFNGNDAGIILNQTAFTKDNPVIYTDLENNFTSLLTDIFNSKGNDAFSKIRMSGLLMLALSSFVKTESQKQVNHNVSAIYLIKAMEYIEQNYSRHLTVQDVADYTGISRSQLYRLFMGQYRQSPIHIIMEYRIRQACQLLSTTKLSISSVGYSVGFEDSLYFSRVFKKIMGFSPKEYIRQIFA
ncbi:AraC family transcriptional regulator [Anaerocolumna sp. MB42-C2]|uniref:AraC family transcriptional regulator n=1 Tax=Anaerocolumna sp. MB42-C2 TaxID=3070997 RepID=UPI0027E21460|nr:AraC family transcriptional regulator [Anaerocolumna sp. MB42-C2]WMJ86263.1 AraC family transcriptional regulator [Anaerocolumna sp. MB42-C2]